MSTEIIIPCSDLEDAMSTLGSLGFRIELVMPADDPSIVVMSGHGLELRLQRGTAAPVVAPPLPPLVASFTICRGGTFHAGRAGMQYRDLIPDRQGGRVIASHIRIPDGGPVADYVHYHTIRFQMIYCYRGWVRLVYEDQGEPFTMRAGDFVVQPPLIPHPVLLKSPGV